MMKLHSEPYLMVTEARSEKLFNVTVFCYLVTAVLPRLGLYVQKTLFGKMPRIVKDTSFHFHSVIWSWHNSKLSE